MRMKKKAIIITAAVLSAALAVGGACFLIARRNDRDGGKNRYDLGGDEYVSDAMGELPEEIGQVNIYAKSGKSAIIPTDTSFTVTTTGKTDAETLAEYITVTPSVPYAIEEVGECEFLLTPAEALDDRQVYRFTVGDAENPVYSFAFQTESGMSVKSTIPADLAAGVPINTGIEVTFTDIIADKDLSGLITLSPKTDGKFTVYPDGKTVVFIPDEALSPDTVYEVTVKKSISGMAGGKLGDDAVFKFRTETEESTDEDKTCIVLSQASEYIFSEDEYPTVRFNVFGNIRDIDGVKIQVNADVYGYKNASDAAETIKKYETVKGDPEVKNYRFKSDGLEHIESIQPEVVKDDGHYSSSRYFSLNSMKKGVYLLNYDIICTLDGEETSYSLQAIIVITDLRLHTESHDGKTVYFVTDRSGVPVGGAEVTAETFRRSDIWSADAGSFEKSRLTCSRDGIAILDGGESDAAIVTVRNENDESVICVRTDADAEREYYPHYIYTDRAVYFADDVCRFTGFMSAGGDAAVPSRLYMYIGTTPCGTVDVTDGRFEGSIPIEDFGGYGFNIRFCDRDGNTLFSRGVTVTQDEKPVYKSSIGFDRIFYKPGDTATVTLTASFFDGTPAPGLEFYISKSDGIGIDEGVYTTDRDGKIVISGDVYTQYPVRSTYPQTIFVISELVGKETTELRNYCSAYFFHSEYFFEIAYGTECAEAHLYMIDTSRIETLEDIYERRYIAEPADGEADITLVKHTTVTVENGSVYNPVTKKNIKNYISYSEEKVVKKYTSEFENGIIKLENMKDEERVYYTYDVTFRDPDRGYEYSEKVWAMTGEAYRYYDRDSLFLGADKDSYAVGDTVHMTLTYGTRKLENVLYCVYDADGLVKYAVSGGEYGFTFEDNMIFECIVTASFYDGGRFMTVDMSPEYDVSRGELTVEVVPDKESYKPGETANVKVRICDRNGNPVPGSLTLSVVDEACFALGDNETHPAFEYLNSPSLVVKPYKNYSSIYRYGYYSSYYVGRRLIVPMTDGRFYPMYELSYEEAYGFKYSEVSRGYEYDLEAENAAKAEEAPADDREDGGNGGGDDAGTYVREDFADNPLFETVTVTGESVVSFKVPDNITEWRITAVAATDLDTEKIENRMLGVGASDVICTLPYFINVSSCENYIVGDDISFMVRSYGNGVGDECEYTAYVIFEGDVNASPLGKKKVSVAGGETAAVNIGKLDSGEYKLHVEGRSGAHSDAVEIGFSVVETMNFADIMRNVSPGELDTVKPVTYPVYLSFSSGACDMLMRVNDRVRSQYVSERRDSMAAYFVSLTASAKLYGYKLDTDADKIKSELSVGSGLISLLSYSEGDAELTAKIMAIAPEALTTARKSSIVEKYYEMLAGGEFNDDRELTAVLLGLASAGEPVLDILYGTAVEADDMSPEAKLYLASAFAYIGDFAAASKVYGDVKNEIGRNGDGGEYYFEGMNTEESIRMTSTALMAASRICRRDAEGMVTYLLSHKSHAGYYGLELASYVKFFMPTEVKTSKFTYSLGGETKEIELRAGRMYTLTLTKQGFESFEIVSCDDDIRVNAAYCAAVDDISASLEKSEGFEISKTIEPYGEYENMYLVTVRFSGESDRYYESFILSDCIPTGMRFVSSIGGYDYVSATNGHNGNVYLSNDGQMMNGHVSLWTPYDYAAENWDTACGVYKFSGEISYIVRGAVDGEFVAEAPMMYNLRTGAYAVGERKTVTVEP